MLHVFTLFQKAQHGEKSTIYEKNGQWTVQLKKGAIIAVPKALKFDRLVAGQIPTGFVYLVSVDDSD